jgi:Reverse transcriptase (RNA-dependent DNA polymerase)
MLAGVPQGSILSPILYSVYTADLPSHPSTTLHTFADDTCILAPHEDPDQASSLLQNHLHSLETWFRRWRIKINTAKCQHITFTLRRATCPPVYINQTSLPVTDVVRYLGLYIDKRLTWNPHTRLKRKDLNRRYKLLMRLLDNRSQLTTDNKLLIYKTIIKPIWTYGLEIWGSTKPSNIKRIQSFQSKVLRKLVNAPFYVPNRILHKDLNVPLVADLASTRYKSFHSSLHLHSNPLVQALSSLTLPRNPPRRLNRHWPRDFLQE